MLTRERAENLLNAYVKANSKTAKDTLREVILDAMTTVEYRPYYPYGYPWYPHTTYTGNAPATPAVTITASSTDAGVTATTANGTGCQNEVKINGLEKTQSL